MCSTQGSDMPKGYYLDLTKNPQNHTLSPCLKGYYCAYGYSTPCKDQSLVGIYLTQAEYNVQCPQGENTPTV